MHGLRPFGKEGCMIRVSPTYRAGFWECVFATTHHHLPICPFIHSFSMLDITRALACISWASPLSSLLNRPIRTYQELHPQHAPYHQTVLPNCKRACRRYCHHSPPQGPHGRSERNIKFLLGTLTFEYSNEDTDAAFTLLSHDMKPCICQRKN